MVALGVALLLAGCANMGLSEAECRGADWYALGKRDGELYGSRSMLDQHTHRCARFGARPDAEQYRIGWEDGDMEYRQRTGWGGGPD
jgi:hypothetical protein